MVAVRNAYKIVVRKPEALGRTRHRWEDNIKKNLTEIGLKGVVLILLAQDRDRWRAPVNTVMDLRAP
jgi:hypothetical protein